MNMVFCRGCSKEIHSTAVTCPQCGASQTAASTTNESSWRAVAAAIFAGLGFIASIGMSPYDHDQLMGTMMLCGGAIGFGGVSVLQKHPRKTLAIVSIVIAVLGGLIALGTTA